MAVAQGADDALDVHDRRWGALQGGARSGVFLMPGHAGDPVVEDDADYPAVVVDGIDQAVDAGERRSNRPWSPRNGLRR